MGNYIIQKHFDTYYSKFDTTLMKSWSFNPIYFQLVQYLPVKEGDDHTDPRRFITNVEYVV